MKAVVFMFLFLWAGPDSLWAQEGNAPGGATVSPSLDPAKVAEYQRRFQQGYDLEKQGQLVQARTIFDGILAEQPDAKRSLLEAGRVSLQLNDFLKADEYLEKLHALVPDFPEAFELLIQANQALKRDVKVERLVREFRALRDSGRVPGFSTSLFFVRERIPFDPGSEIVFTQFFDFTQPPYYALKGELFNPEKQRTRVLLLKYDPEGTAALHAKDPKAQNGTVFILAEPAFTADRMTKIDVYQELFATPDYMKARNLMLGIFANPPKPIYSTPVDAPAE